MINKIHSLIHATQRGWDPISKAQANEYFMNEITKVDRNEQMIKIIKSRINKLSGIRILDLGAGPGILSLSLAREGADVYWHDVSLSFQSIAQKMFIDNGYVLNCTIDYLDNVLSYYNPESFDVVINNICWYYCFDDKRFAQVIHNLLKSNGTAIINSYIPPQHRFGFRYNINRIFGYKIGHPFPAPGSIAKYFIDLDPSSVEYSRFGNDNEIIIVEKK